MKNKTILNYLLLFILYTIRISAIDSSRIVSGTPRAKNSSEKTEAASATYYRHPLKIRFLNQRIFQKPKNLLFEEKSRKINTTGARKLSVITQISLHIAHLVLEPS